MCGSGRRYGQCCRPKAEWQLICYNPGMKGYSGVVPQEVTIEAIDPLTLKQRLDDDPRLAITEDTPSGGFWIYWGDPALEDPEYGILCFGDLELRPDGTLLVTAISDVRMQTLLALLAEIAADCLGPVPPIQKEPPLTIKKVPRPHRRRYCRAERTKRSAPIGSAASSKSNRVLWCAASQPLSGLRLPRKMNVPGTSRR